MINYTKGDATEPRGQGHKYILHICNNAGQWGAGFVMALSAKWDEPEFQYRRMAADKKLKLGVIQFVPVEKDITVVNMIAQDNITLGLKRRVDYHTLSDCLGRVYYNMDVTASVHMPRIGCGIGGGNWDTVEYIVEQELKETSVTVYDLT